MSFNLKSLYKDELINHPHTWTIQNVHDPGIFKDGDTYYIFSTDAAYKHRTSGVQIRKSKDLVNWEYVGQAIPVGVPQEAKDYTNAVGLWAPDVVKVGNEYWMYYSASTFGSTQSAIGLAKSHAVTGPYQHEALVYKSVENQMDMPNAIDPCIVYDQDNRMYMVYGSFFGGIHIVELEKKTGLIKNKGDKGTLIAGGGHKAIEGPYIIYHEKFKYYYLFVSYESLAYNYNVRVARSKNITGPYVDSMGLDMRDVESNPGNKIINSYQFDSLFAYLAPGHNSVLKDHDKYYIIHHSRATVDDVDLKGYFFLNVREVFFTEDGWPIVAPNRFKEDALQAIDKNSLNKPFKVICFDKFNDGMIKPRLIDLVYKVSGNDITINYKDELYHGKILKMFNEEMNEVVICFTAMNKDGECIWGQST